MDVSPLAPAGGFPALPVIDGVRFAAIEAGVRHSGRPDVMLVDIAPGSTVAGVFTRSATRSAPVLWCEACLAQRPVADQGFAIIANSGNANAFTGANGADGVAQLVAETAKVTGVPEAHVYVASTGVIGEALPADKITSQLTTLQAHLAQNSGEAAARAIMTTDTFPKGASEVVEINGQKVRIAGYAKGSGMIEPDMGTMLGFLYTDAALPQPMLQAMLAELTDSTFNAITVDSDTSTSDTVLLFATGRSGVDVSSGVGREIFHAALHSVLLDLAKQIVRDGEGATKLVEVTVTGAQSDTSAKRVAKAIANSPLVKTAIAGEDPNWGRIVMAIGKAGEPADRDRISIHFGDILVAENGWVASSYAEEAGAAYMKAAEISITVDLGIGHGTSTVWTCDLTHGYISINADYRS